jgi:succinate dehydrogenase / fumarate reductase cytochrome b subunit
MKITMAVTGIILLGFVFVHMIGNLQIFLPDPTKALGDYAEYLESLGHGGVKWGARIVLLASVGLHILSAFRLVALQREARPVEYASRRNRASTYASRTMRWSGPIILLFIVYHLLHLTAGKVDGGYVEHQVYRSVYDAFSNPGIAGFYILAQLALGPHLAHGAYSLLRSLGMENAERAAAAKKLAVGFGLLITVGNCSIPLYVLSGKAPTPTHYAHEEH